MICIKNNLFVLMDHNHYFAIWMMMLRWRRLNHPGLRTEHLDVCCYCLPCQFCHIIYNLFVINQTHIIIINHHKVTAYLLITSSSCSLWWLKLFVFVNSVCKYYFSPLSFFCWNPYMNVLYIYIYSRFWLFDTPPWLNVWHTTNNNNNIHNNHIFRI